MYRLPKRDDYTIDPDETEEATYHIKPTGSTTYTATVKHLPNNSYYRRWGARPYNSPNEPWRTRPSKREAVALALTLDVPRETTAKEK